MARAIGYATLLMLLAFACARDDPATRLRKANERCKARYDIYQRWITGRGRLPETDAERAEAEGGGELDPWGHPYVFEVEGGPLVVWSNGPDGLPETGDDIRYPPAEE